MQGKQLQDYIVVMDGAVTNGLCDAILNEYKESEDWVSALIEKGEFKDKRNCQTISISLDYIISKNTAVRKPIDKYLHTSAFNAIKHYIEEIKKYTNDFPHCVIEEDSGYELLKYEVDNFYTEHTDSFKARPRAVSCSFMLNDNYEGGEFAFFDRELVYKLKKGSCIMFPSNFMYPHEIMPVTSGTRYSIVTWFV